MSVLLESLVRDKSQATEAPISVMLVSFLAVGVGAALAFGMVSAFIISLNTGLPDWVASALAYIVLMSAAYGLHRKFSFRSQAPHAQAFPRYALAQTSGLALAALFSFVAYQLFGMHLAFASPIVLALTSVVNFVALRLWAFR
jgi:putative flippase GtrA